jgi:ribonuclease HI
MIGEIIVHTDGGSRGNPGPAASAFVVESDGKILKKGSSYLGRNTNNSAEYKAVLLALEWFNENPELLINKKLIFVLDSELVVRQLNGIYKIKKPELITLNLSIRKAIEDLGVVAVFKNVPRSENKIADALVNEELDKH